MRFFRGNFVFAALLSVLALGACTPMYMQPSSPSTAFVRLRLDDPRIFAVVFTYEKEQCKGPQAIGMIGGRQFLDPPKDAPRFLPFMMGSSGVAEPQVIEIKVDTAKPLTLLYRQIGPHSSLIVRSCNLPVTFHPVAGEQYEVRYSYDEERCYSSVERLVGDSSSFRREPVKNAFKEAGKCTGYVLF